MNAVTMSESVETENVPLRPVEEVLREQEPAQPKKLSRQDKLEIENLYLKVENLKLQQERMTQELLQANVMRQGIQQEMATLQAELSAKYGVDMSQVKILPDGTVLPGDGK